MLRVLVVAAIAMKMETCPAIGSPIFTIFAKMAAIAGMVILGVAARADMDAAGSHLDLGGGGGGERDDESGNNK
jgi:hypothetical protein